MSHYRLSSLARADIIEILVWSRERFGAAARDRYQALLVTAIGDLAADPARVGSKSRPELGDGVRSWHIRHSRARSPAEPLHAPRHFLVYKSENGLVVIGRVLHDAMDLSAHVDPDATWE